MLCMPFGTLVVFRMTSNYTQRESSALPLFSPYSNNMKKLFPFIFLSLIFSAQQGMAHESNIPHSHTSILDYIPQILCLFILTLIVFKRRKLCSLFLIKKR